MTERQNPLLVPAPGLIIRHWDGEAGVVFDASRAVTHLLDISVIDLLEGGPVAADSIDPDTLGELLRLGLLRRAR